VRAERADRARKPAFGAPYARAHGDGHAEISSCHDEDYDMFLIREFEQASRLRQPVFFV
jgi:hypothetical protein